MNCDDLGLLLERGGSARLAGEAGANARAHLAICPECARDWSLQNRLADRRVPPMPANLVESCRALATEAAQNGPGRRGRGRFIVVGLTALAAAAAMLAVHLNAGRHSSEQSAETAAAMPPAIPAAAASPAFSSLEVPHPQGEKVGMDAADQTAEPAPPFPVYVAPLQNSATDAVRLAAIESFYESVLQQLRAVPGLRLLQSMPKDAAPGGPQVIKLTIVGSTPSPGTEFTVRTMLDAKPLPGGGFSATHEFIGVGDVAFACADPRPAATSQCRDPVSLAVRVAEALRWRSFPADPSLHKRMRAQVRDPALAPELRFHAFSELASLRSPPGSRGPGSPGSPAFSDPEVIRGVIELAAVTTDAGQRSELWRAMRGVGSELILQPLADAARLDPAAEVRAEAVATLAADFAQDPRGRAALETIARDDPSPLLRASATRGLGDEATWKEYVAASLRDTSRPAAERIEALLLHIRWPSPPGSRFMGPWEVAEAALDADTTAALIEVYPKAYASAADGAKLTLITLVSNAAYNSGNPAFTNLVLENLEHGPQRPSWIMAAEGLLRRKDADPRVREALVTMAASSVDAQFRDAAKSVLLRTTPDPARPEDSPR
jgi:hypothetical protein